MRKVGKLKVVGPLVLLMFALVLTACGSSSSSSGGGSETSEGASGSEVKVGLVSETAGFNDHAFNGLALKGLKQAESQLGVEGLAVSSASVSDYVPNLSSLARQGYNPIVAVGFQMAESVSTVAKSFPETSFAIIDVSQSEVGGAPENVVGLVFNQAEASYLAGYLAAEFLSEPGNEFGTVGGEAIPPVQSWMTGYTNGVAHGGGGEVLSAFSQTFADQAPCKQLAENQISEGATAIFNVAGGCGLGIYAAVSNDPGIWYIGIDADQSFLGDHVLTSAVKKVENAVFDVAKLQTEGKLKGGTDLTFSLKNEGVGLGAVSSKVPSSVMGKVEAVEKELLAGKIDPESEGGS